jgi:hypothetical protein
MRARWKKSDGKIWEWDSQHAEFEVYSANGKTHLGSFNLKGKRITSKNPNPIRTVEP